MNIRPGDKVLEPSCGDGRILIAAHAYEPNVSITAIEMEPNRANDLRNNPSILATKALLVEGDFLTVDLDMNFDVIVMNPPFVSFQDIHHVTRAIDLLAEGGRFAGVMSAGILFRETKLHFAFRKTIYNLGGQFTKLEDGAFKESGTMVSSILLTLTK